VADYGWSNAEPMCSQTYLLEPIARLLRQADARRVLDLGCGNGSLTHALQRQGFQLVGCDADRGGIEIASATDAGAVFKTVSVYDDPGRLGETAFDAVVSTEVIEHLFAPAALPRFAAAVLKPRGTPIVSTPYHGYLKNVAIRLAGKWDHHDSLREGGHIKFWSRRTLSELLGRNGFSDTVFVGAGRCRWLWKSMIVAATAAGPHRSS
jgi:SAM-dependent methyltransferase